MVNFSYESRTRRNNANFINLQGRYFFVENRENAKIILIQTYEYSIPASSTSTPSKHSNAQKIIANNPNNLTTANEMHILRIQDSIQWIIPKTNLHLDWYSVHEKCAAT